ncbi:MAG: zinc ribbon domain-containing protein [Butyrivibrio sp.]|nr:zinc ribbon domain-containing protein [Butyrivibrio sp.]
MNLKRGDRMKCPKCGNEIPENTTFCKHCGARIN